MARARGPGRRSGMSSDTISLYMSQAELANLKRAIRAAGNEARSELRRRIKAAGEIVQHAIQRRTPVHSGSSYGSGRRVRRTSGDWGGSTYKQTHAPGLLKKSTRVKPSTLSVTIYNNAVAKSRKYPHGYRYGKRLEFDPKYAGKYAFFYPGVAASQRQALDELDHVLEAASRAFLKK